MQQQSSTAQKKTCWRNMLETMLLWTRKMTKLTRLAQVFAIACFAQFRTFHCMITEFSRSLLILYTLRSQPCDGAGYANMTPTLSIENDSNQYPKIAETAKVCVCERERERVRERGCVRCQIHEQNCKSQSKNQFGTEQMPYILMCALR